MDLKLFVDNLYTLDKLYILNICTIFRYFVNVYCVEVISQIAMKLLSIIILL